MVDMSGSTKGWINQAEREALILLAAALETLEDRFAIYGFSGLDAQALRGHFPSSASAIPMMTWPRAASAASSPETNAHGGPHPPPHRVLRAEDARIKLLITLSDGKPDDYDPQYRGEYGIEDTRQALFEARLDGVHPFCITIDEQGPEYLPHMYGAANYVLVADVARLPAKVSEIYRRLTS